jgi:integrase
VPETTKAESFGDFADRWLAQHPNLKPRTRLHYRHVLDARILPTFGPVPVADITAEQVLAWYAKLDQSTPTARAHAYSLSKTILQSAIFPYRLIAANPAQIKGAGTTDRVVKIQPASIPELTTIADAMPAKYRAAVMVSAFCALRFGELAELRVRDVDLQRGVIHVRRAVTVRSGQTVVGVPKSSAGIRDVAIPPHLIPMLADHIDKYAGKGRDPLVFPAADGRKHLAPSTLYKPYKRARRLAGRPDLRWHDLRHTGSVMAAGAGASLAELMSRLGHSTVTASLRYQHVALGRDQQIAQALSDRAASEV